MPTQWLLMVRTEVDRAVCIDAVSGCRQCHMAAVFGKPVAQSRDAQNEAAICAHWASLAAAPDWIRAGSL